MRKSALTALLVLACTVQAAPALAATSSTSTFAGRYTSAYTQWSTTAGTVATTHSEAATRAGIVRAQATAAAREIGWAAISVGTVSQSATVDKNAAGYRVIVTFTGVDASSTGTQPEGNIGTENASDTTAALGVGVRLSGACTASVPCHDTRTVVSQHHDSVTLTVDYPAVATKSTMIVRATAETTLKTPTNDGASDSASVAATVASIKITPLS